MKKLKHQAPKFYRVNRFNSITIEGDFAYCKSHNFIYNQEKEEELLHKGLPCYYTDNRFIDGDYNFYKETKLFWRRFRPISLKSCIRRTLNCKNIPVGAIVKFNTSWYHIDKDIDTSYFFKIKKENQLKIDYEISIPSFFNNFKYCNFSQCLTDALRKAGFLVQVYNSNPDFLIGEDEGGEFAIAYGYNKKIGFSSKNFTFRGYTNGCDNILWDYYDEFDKWSRSQDIPKTMPIEKIIETLTK